MRRRLFTQASRTAISSAFSLPPLGHFEGGIVLPDSLDDEAGFGIAGNEPTLLGCPPFSMASELSSRRPPRAEEPWHPKQFSARDGGAPSFRSNRASPAFTVCA